MKPRFLWLLAFVFLGTACSSVGDRRENASEIARGAAFTPVSYQTDTFTLSGYLRKGEDSAAPIVYIEGDGFAWVDRSTVSSNPTPKNPLALELASIDDSPTVLYLARPCQFVALSAETNCSRKYWTKARFAPEVIDSFDQALSQAKQDLGAEGFHLVGFSGGAAVAALLAARREDIRSLRTVAGNLDHVALNKDKQVSQLTESLDPMKSAQALRDMPQIHFSGGQDDVVPDWVVHHFIEAVDNAQCTSHIIVPGAGHLKGWVEAWKALYNQRPQC